MKATFLHGYFQRRLFDCTRLVTRPVLEVAVVVLNKWREVVTRLTLDSEIDGGRSRGADAVVGRALVEADFLAAHCVEIQDGAFKCLVTRR